MDSDKTPVKISVVPMIATLFELRRFAPRIEVETGEESKYSVEQNSIGLREEGLNMKEVIRALDLSEYEIRKLVAMQRNQYFISDKQIAVIRTS